MKCDWILKRLTERSHRSQQASHTTVVLSNIWSRLPETIQSQLEAYRERVPHSNFDVTKTKDKYTVHQTSPVQADVTITRNNQRSSIVATYGDSARLEVTVAFTPFSGDRFDGLIQRLLDPVFFPDLHEMAGQVKWEDIELKPRSRNC